jgi:hypothetical protein
VCPPPPPPYTPNAWQITDTCINLVFHISRSPVPPGVTSCLEHLGSVVLPGLGTLGAPITKPWLVCRRGIEILPPPSCMTVRYPSSRCLGNVCLVNDATGCSPQDSAGFVGHVAGVETARSLKPAWTQLVRSLRTLRKLPHGLLH